MHSFLSIGDITQEEMHRLFDSAHLFRQSIKARKSLDSLRNREVGLLFEKPSTRTRTSFEVATERLGGNAVYLPSSELQLSRGEPVKDTARILGGYLDVIVARVFLHHTVEELAKWGKVPVINGLSDLEHPTQIVCDFFTIREARGKVEGLKLAFIGDGNNVCHSLLLGGALVGMDISVACPDGYRPDPGVLDRALREAKKTGAVIEVVRDPGDAVTGADILYTDVWVSMGEEKEREKRLRDFAGYQINRELLDKAGSAAQVMHCLPAHRGLEITDEMIEGPRSLVWAQGENKLYGAAAVLDAAAHLQE